MARTKIVDLLAEIKPSLVIMPWRRDPHCDHRDSWILMTDALRHAKLSTDVLEYAIWLEELGAENDYPAAGEVDIVSFKAPDLVALKRHAIDAHVSQLGALISDDPEGFHLTARTLSRLIGPEETFWRARYGPN